MGLVQVKEMIIRRNKGIKIMLKMAGWHMLCWHFQEQHTDGTGSPGRHIDIRA